MADTGGNAAIRAGRAFVEIFTDDRKMVRGLKVAQARLRSFGDGVNAIGRNLLVAGTGLAAPLLAAVKSFTAGGSELFDMAQRTGLSVEALSELGFVAQQTGTDMGALEIGVRKLQNALVDAGRGSKGSVDALALLGLTIEDFKGLSPEESFEKIGRAIAGITDPTIAAAAATELLGRSGTQLIPLFAQMDEGRRRARELGLTFSTQLARNADRLGDKLDELWAVVRMGVKLIGGSLAPIVEAFAEHLTRAAVAASDFIKRNGRLLNIVLAIAVPLLAAGGALLSLGVGIRIVAFALGGLAGVLRLIGPVASIALKAIPFLLGALATPAGLAVIAIAALGAAILKWTGAGGAALRWLGDRFSEFRDTAGLAVAGMIDALAAGDFSLALNVLWAGARVAFEQGIAPLRSLWNDFRFFFEFVAINAFSGFKTAWIKVRDWFEANFPNFTANIAKAFANVGAAVKKVWATVVNFIADQMLEVMGMFDETLDVEAAKKLGSDQLDADLQDIERQRQADIDEAERRRQRSDQEREKEKADALAQVVADKEQALADLASADAARIADAKRELQDARDELQRARDAAAHRRTEAEAARAGEEPLRSSPNFDGLDDLADQVRNKIDVRGIFGSTALQSLQSKGASVAERTAKATEKTANNTERMLREMGGGLAFA